MIEIFKPCLLVIDLLDPKQDKLLMKLKHSIWKNEIIHRITRLQREILVCGRSPDLMQELIKAINTVVSNHWSCGLGMNSEYSD